MKSVITMLLFFVAFTPISVGQSFSPPHRLARAAGQEITEDNIKAEAKRDLDNLHKKQLQSEAAFRRDEQSIYEHTLDALVTKRVIAAEAEKRGVTPRELVTSELADDKLTAPTDQEINAFLEANKKKINLPVDEAQRQIKAYLVEQKRLAKYDLFVAELKAKYGVEVYLQPLRTEVGTVGSPTKGPADAPVTIVEFGDFECPYCAELFTTLKQIEDNYADKIRFVFRQFPLDAHPHAEQAAEASLCAFEQDKFWEMHDAIFQDNRNLTIVQLNEKAANQKINMAAFTACMDSGKYVNTISNDVADGSRIGVSGTPTLFINGRFLSGLQPYVVIAKLVDEELAKKSPK